MRYYIKKIQKYFPFTLIENELAIFNWYFTPLFLLSLAALLKMIMKQDDAVACPYNTEPMENKECLLASLSSDGRFLNRFEIRSVSIEEYRWVYVFVFVIAISLLIPMILWHILQMHINIPVNYFSSSAKNFSNMSPLERTIKINKLVVLLVERLLKPKKRLGVFSCFILLKFLSFCITCFYICGIFCFIFGHPKFFEYFLEGLTGYDVEPKAVFSREVRCMRWIKSINKATKKLLPCVMKLNNLNYKLFIALCLVLFASAILIIVDIYFNFIHAYKFTSITRQLELMFDSVSDDELKSFKNFLGRDGIFILKFVNNHSEVAFNQLVAEVYKKYIYEENNAIYMRIYERLFSSGDRPHSMEMEVYEFHEI
ncbi:unnamed protein product [Caenorhabditis bovis]|uniref:Innexin n=1 Tax=Caenorhabditis bovis TaxID=2654633 RepID=A0A8S1EI45_9PELO|nr:unnamed protein product [Caenorhabditis bovis]